MHHVKGCIGASVLLSLTLIIPANAQGAKKTNCKEYGPGTVFSANSTTTTLESGGQAIFRKGDLVDRKPTWAYVGTAQCPHGAVEVNYGQYGKKVFR